MKDKRKKQDVPDDMFMLMAEDARIANTFNGTGMPGQQILMDRFSHIHSVEDEQRLIDKLTK